MNKIIIGFFITSVYVLGNQLQWDCTDKVFKLNYEFEKANKLQNPKKIDKMKDLLIAIYEVSDECKTTDVNKDFDLDGDNFFGTDNLKIVIKKIIKGKDSTANKMLEEFANKEGPSMIIQGKFISSSNYDNRKWGTFEINGVKTQLLLLLDSPERLKNHKNEILSLKYDPEGGVLYDFYVKDSTSSKGINTTNADTMELLRIFAIDESVNYNIYDWNTGIKASLIDWKYTGIQEALAYNGKPRSDYSYKREGIATIENNDKWNITLLGARGGYFIVELYTELLSENPPKLVLDKKYILEEKHCEEGTSYNTSRYLIKFENKKPFWLQEMFSSGSGGSSYYYTILYDNKPKCETGVINSVQKNGKNKTVSNEKTVFSDIGNSFNPNTLDTVLSSSNSSDILKCSDYSAKKLVKEITAQEIAREKLMKATIPKHRYMWKDFKAKHEQIEKIIDSYDLKVISIRTDSIDEKVKKTTCKAQVKSGNGHIVNITYTVQKTSDGQLFVEVFGL